MPEVLSSAEAEALTRFVHDLQSRMKSVAELLKQRGTPGTAGLAGSIAHELYLLEKELADPANGLFVSSELQLPQRQPSLRD